MSHHDSFSPQYQGTPPAVLYYTCPWTVTPAAKSQLEASFTVEIDSLGLVSSSPFPGYPFPRILLYLHAIPDIRCLNPRLNRGPLFNFCSAYEANNAA